MDEEYKMGDAVLGRTTQEKDLGVTFSADMKVSEQCGIAASKGNQILGLIRRTIMYKEKQLIIPPYKAVVRPHLEYCIQAWRLYCKKHIDKLERIQRRATKMIPELRDLSYESHLLQCGFSQAKGPDGKWTRKPLAYQESNNVHLLITRPTKICVNLVFKHIHAASSYTICRQFVPFIYCPL